ncbi:MBL fold metallo-hydrolase [Hydrocarboniphaga effusa]|jgi:ribonuclease BN (tRNA processing enzyme)|uniref:MBL fold metallo-hydrolase n=2 Tax=Hydrocarboniphaga effusa TaxID=243629 RepID=UPI003137989A
MINRSAHHIRRPLISLLASIGLSCALMSAPAQAEPSREAKWVTLGTGSGPLSFFERGQPANLLRAAGQSILVDAGDGATEQLIRTGVLLDDVGTVFISHLHFDHTGGLFAFLGRRFQTRQTSALTIYGPPGIKRTIDGLIAAMQPMNDAEGTKGVFAVLGRPKPGENIKTIELTDGAQVKIGDIRITAATNSHYVLADEKGTGNHSFALRFDAPGRSIVYTGDTGPSEKVEKLAKGADLLVAEIMDADEALDRIGKSGLKINFALAAVAKVAIKDHFVKEHLSPEDVGSMAQRAGVKALVLTHNALGPDNLEPARKRIAAAYPGPVTFAQDGRAY